MSDRISVFKLVSRVIVSLAIVVVFLFTLNGCEDESHIWEPENSDELIINPYAKFPEENPNLVTVRVVGDTLFLVYNGGSLPEFKYGDIVVGEMGGGYMKKVISSNSIGNTVILLTEQACLTDVIWQGSFDTTFYLMPEEDYSFIRSLRKSYKVVGDDGNLYTCELQASNIFIQKVNDFTFTINLGSVYITLKNEENLVAFTLSVGSIVIKQSIKIDKALKINWLGLVKRFKLVATMNTTLYLKNVRLDCYKSINDDVRIKITTVSLGKIPIFFPIYISFSIGIYTGVDASIMVGASTEICNNLSITYSKTAGAEYLDGSWFPISSTSLDGDAEVTLVPSVDIRSEINPYLKFSLDAKIAGVLGPSMYIKPYQYNSIYFPPVNYELGVGISGGLAFKVEILSQTLAEFNWTLVDYRKRLVRLFNRPPNTPSVPSGPSTGNVGLGYTFSTSATDPDGDNVKIIIDWGDGSRSESDYVPSGRSVSLSHSWSSAGTYRIKAKAEDVSGSTSGWSPNSYITISYSTNHPPNTPSVPSGPSTGNVGLSYTFSTSATDPDGDNVKIIIDWGDGSRSESDYVPSGESVSLSHSWSSAGTYRIKAKAEDVSGSTSGWSPSSYITISYSTNHPPNTPLGPSGPSIGYVGFIYVFSTFATDPDGDNVKIIIDWGDGSRSESGYVPSGTSVSLSHSWSSPGTYHIRAKAVDTHGAESGWSGGHVIEVELTEVDFYDTEG